MYGRAVRPDEHGKGNDDAPELDERTRFQYLAVSQYLRDHDLFEAKAAFQRETGVDFEDGGLPVASVLEASLDMFSHYQLGGDAFTGKADVAAHADEEELQRLQRGACCTGPCPQGAGTATPCAANVTSVVWAARSHDELVAIAATADKKLWVLGPHGETLVALSGLASSVLGLDVTRATEEVLATAMGGEALLLRLERPPLSTPGLDHYAVEQASGSPDPVWRLDVLQRFRDHTKHATSGLFAPAEHCPPAFFVTVSRDRQAKLYSRPVGATGDFSLAFTVQLGGEVTCCCWAGDTTFVLAARDDCNLHYMESDPACRCERDQTASLSGDALPHERMRTNLNAQGDSVVSFTVLAMAVSPNRKLLAVCTDKSRVIVLRTFTARQLRNMYGATVDEYDMPSVCFSLDQSFLYVTSSWPQEVLQRCRDGPEVSRRMCGEVVVFEVRTGEAVLRLPCHSKSVRCMSRHPCSECLATGSFDKTIKYWG